MSSQQLELPYLRVLHEHEAFDLTPLAGQSMVEALTELRLEEALSDMAAGVHAVDRVDHVAAVHSLVLGSRLEEAGADTGAGPGVIAEALVAPFNVDRPEAGAEILVDVVKKTGSSDTIEPDGVAGLVDAFDGSLIATTDPLSGVVTFSGPAAPTAAALLDIATALGPDHIACTSQLGDFEVDGTAQIVTLVEVERCTNLPFDMVRKGIDPRRWPDHNPFFKSVKVLGAPPPSQGSWAGVIREEVGVDGATYVTDLSVTYVEHPLSAAVTFDLAPDDPPEGMTPDDGRVTVDHGFLSATDEGPHRRIRMLKAYRIDDLDIPLDWVCPLWAGQLLLSGWWSA